MVVRGIERVARRARGEATSGMLPSPGGRHLPRRGNGLSRALGAAALGVAGWRIEGRVPDAPKLVLAVAPHTSNWDFLVGVAAMFALGVRVHWLGKHTLFRPPLGPLMRWLGGTPVDRSTARGAVEQVVAAFRAHDRFLLGLSPEGTRRKRDAWRTGFYHIARGAAVPVVPVALDYGRRAVTIFAPVPPTGDEAADLRRIQAPFQAAMARFPAQF